MFSLKAENIYDVAAPLHIASQLIGLTAFSIRRKKEIFVESVSLFNLTCLTSQILQTVSVIFIFITNIDELWRNNANRIYSSQVSDHSMFCVVLSIMICMMVTSLWFLGSRKYFALIFNWLYEVDEELMKLKSSTNYRKHKKVVLSFTYLVMTLMAASFFLTIYLANNTNLFISSYIFLFLSMHVCMETNIFIIFHFTFIMWAVKLRYEKINSIIKENFLSSSLIKLKDENEKLVKIASLHDKLVDASECINRCYGVPVSSSPCRKIFYFMKT